MTEYIPPALDKDAFQCPHCGAYASQYSYVLQARRSHTVIEVADGRATQCLRCNKWCLWLNGKMVYPSSQFAPLPNPDMPEDVKADYMEARQIVQYSPRAAAALVRLALQRLMPHLGEKGKNINDDIASLARKGLSPLIQRSLDAVRVIGNNAVHPGEIDLTDDEKTALSLFQLVNLVVEQMISQPKHVAEMYEKIPQHLREKIDARDSPKP